MSNYKLISILCCAVCMMTTVSAIPVYTGTFSVLSAHAEEVQTEITASFTNTSVQAGVPLTVTLNNATAEITSYRWTVGGKEISQNSASYTPTEADYEKMISVTVTADGKDYTCSAYCSILPVVYLHTDTEITSKTEYIDGTCTIQGNAEYSDETQLYSGAMQIRGRGNYTWVHDKKPYKIKLDTKTDVLGMGTSKHWVLLAEYMDPTHLRNEIMPELSRIVDMEYTADSKAVAVVLNGEYNGVYHLSENVRIADDRVNIYDWEETAEEIAKALYKEKKASGMTKTDRDDLEDQLVQNLDWITSGVFTWNDSSYQVSDYVQIPDRIDGGYLLELDTYDDYHVKQISDFNTEADQPIQFKSPEYAVTNSELYNYAKDYIQSFENAVSADDYYADYNNISKHYSQLFDMDSLVKYWMILELSSNCDGMRYSNYMYKDFDTLFKMGPAWDFDWTWNASYIVPADEWWTDQNYYNNSVHWYKNLVKDPYFITKAYELYQAHKDEFNAISKDGGLFDTLAETYAISSKADLAKWHSDQNYESELEKTKEYITQRFAWLGQQFDSVESLAESLGYEASDKLAVAELSGQNGSILVKASVSDDSAETVTFHINGIFAGEAEIQNGTASLNISSSLLNQDSTALNTIQIRMKDAQGKYLAQEADSSGWGGRGGWNPWEPQNTASERTVYSNFKTFSADELGVSPAVPGDVNCDGIVNIFDFVLLKQHFLKSGTLSGQGLANADCNADGTVSLTDIIKLQKFLLTV